MTIANRYPKIPTSFEPFPFDAVIFDIGNTLVGAAAPGTATDQLVTTYLHGSPRTLAALHHYGVRLGAVTDTAVMTEADVRSLLSEPQHVTSSVSDLLEVVVTSVDIGAEKPDPRGLAAAIMALGIDPRDDANRVLFVGDSDVDEGAARALGCAFARASAETPLHEVLRSAFLEAGASPIDTALALVAPLDVDTHAAASAHQALLLKPAGALGLLESVGIQLAAITGVNPPAVPQAATVGVFGADHGVHAEGVSPWPQLVTAQMAAAVAGGGAAVSVLARAHGATVRMIDVGIATPTEHIDGVEQWKFRDGTANFATGPAMSRVDALAAMSVGVLVALEAIAAGAEILCTGDLGIGNTSASAALIAALTRSDAAAVTGRGSGIDDATLELKTNVVANAVERVINRNPSIDPLVVLEEVGGLEHAAICGFIIGAASARVPVVLDGVIAVSAALVAVGLSPTVRDSLIGGHRSAEPGATIALEHLGIAPLVDLGMRLGEGTGAVSALPLIRSAAAIMGEMATFESAGLA